MTKRAVGLVVALCALGSSSAALAAPHDVEVAGKGHRYIIWLVPTLDDGTTKPPLTSGDVTRYCAAAENFAQRIYKVTNGLHKIFQVQFVYGDAPMRVDGVWKRADGVANGPDGAFNMFDAQVEAVHTWSEEPGVPNGASGSGNVRKSCQDGVCVTATCPTGFTVQPVAFSVNRERCVDANGNSPIESAIDAGFVMAHETGHSHYDLTDEYLLNEQQPITYGFRICSNPEWHTSIMGTRDADFWCDANTHLSARKIPSPFSGTITLSSTFVATNGDQWTKAKKSWVDLMSYNPGPAFVQGPGVVPQNDYFTKPAGPWAPLPTDTFCEFTGSEFANQIVNDVAVVVDKSGSMGYRLTSQDLTAFEHALSAGLAHYNRTQGNRKVGLSVFDSAVTRTIPYGMNSGARALSDFSLSAGGLTNLCAAISDTALQVRQSGTNDAVGHMVLLTDGRPTVAGCNTAEAVRSAAQEACFPTDGGKPVTISTLAFGDADYALIQQIADVCGGNARMVDGSGQNGAGSSGGPVAPAGAPALPPGAAKPISIQTAASRLAYRVRNYQEALFVQEQLPSIYERSFDVPPGTSELELVWMGERDFLAQDPDSHSGNRCQFDQNYKFEIVAPNGNLSGADVVPASTELTYMTRTRRVVAPLPGRWTMRTTGGAPCIVPQDPTAPEVAMLAVFRSNRVKARLLLDKPSAAANEPIRATLALEIASNTLQKNLSVAAKLVNGTTQLSLAMTDDGANGDALAGDGIYTATINPSCAAQNLTPGGYRLVAEVQADAATGQTVLDPARDVQLARGGGGSLAAPISVSLVEEKLLSIRGCNAPAACGGVTSQNLCPAEGAQVDGSVKVKPGTTTHDVTVTVHNCPIASHGVKVGIGPGFTTSNVRSSYVDTTGTGTVTFDVSAAPDVDIVNQPVTIEWGGHRCDTTGTSIPVCRETPLTLASSSIPVCGSGGANDVTLTPPSLIGSCFETPTVVGRVVQSNGVTLAPPRAIPSSGLISLAPGTHLVEWVISGGGATQTSTQTIYVLAGFAAGGSFTIGDRARTLTSSGGYAAITNGGSGVTDLGVESHSGDISSVGNVSLRDRSTVHGFVKTGGTLVPQNLTTVTGSVLEHQSLLLGGISNPTVDFPVLLPASDISVGPDAVLTLAPSPHRQVTIYSRSTLTLSAGDYLFESLDIEPDAKVVVTPQTRIFVKTSMIYRGKFANAAGQLAETFLAYYGTTPLWLESNFSGSLLAASGKVVLGDGDSHAYQGRIVARDIELRPDVILTCTGASSPLFRTTSAGATLPLVELEATGSDDTSTRRSDASPIATPAASCALSNPGSPIAPLAAVAALSALVAARRRRRTSRWQLRP